MCLTNFTNGTLYSYPEDFGSIRNHVEMYTCPVSNLRILKSNGIPNHDVILQAEDPLCITEWMVFLPLHPMLVANDSITEVSARGILAIGINGIPVMGSQDYGGDRALEYAANQTSSSVRGHSAKEGDWHYHYGDFGGIVPGNVYSNFIVGYAMDGFPIYGPLEDDSVLDECNGMTGEDGTYRYHVRKLDQVNTSSSYCNDGSADGGSLVAVNWNYVLGCFKGNVSMGSAIHDGNKTAIPDDCVLEELVMPTMPPTAESFPYSAATTTTITSRLGMFATTATTTFLAMWWWGSLELF